ncbi:unnamed protein product [Fraxinus pennsylvanica]|uniref:non-specific serine/threonine protein kinase n=1 Tax=Fraxinus pennsylvanica TaxID=56036 RepID=A0AAD1YUK5_9LAMI|nr:unnamed protein product [Fraxinus pennsylvanica]
MSCFSFCMSQERIKKKLSKKSIQDHKDNKSLASFANISYKSDSSRRRYITEEIEKLGKGNISSQIFTFHELSVATQDFNPETLIGEGGFGRVYKGHIESKNTDVAVKKLDRNGFQGNREFLVEVLILSLLHHPNLVNLVGYCSDGDQRILVYEYMPNGSLEDHLLSQLTTKSDVYSFGVVFLELITGRRVIDNSRPSEEQNLITWVQPLFKDKKKFHLIADPLLEGNYPEKALCQALAVAAMCLQEEASTRPLISDVVTALEYLSVGKGQAENKEEAQESSTENTENNTPDDN